MEPEELWNEFLKVVKDTCEKKLPKMKKQKQPGCQNKHERTQESKKIQKGAF